VNTLKKAWLTEWPTADGLYTLSLESAETDQIHRLSADHRCFPANPTPEHPLRHVVKLALLSDDDLRSIRDAINGVIGE
jgi:hypothetical protein